MGQNRRLITLTLTIVALATTPAIGEWAGSRLVYDPFWRDYHHWSPGETRRYQQWEAASNRNHMDFSDRTPGDQLAYWDWRHNKDAYG
jgi:hypothetical protein